MTEHELAAGAAASAPRRGTFLPSAAPVTPNSVAEAGDLIMPIYAAPVVHDGATRASGVLPAAAALTFDVGTGGAGGLRRAGQIATAGMAAAVIAVIAAAFAPVPNSSTTAYDASAQADTIDRPYPSSTSKPLAAEGGRIKVDLHKPDAEDVPSDVPSLFGIPLPEVPFIQDVIGGGTPPANDSGGSSGGSQADAPGGLPTSDPRADVPQGSAGDPVIPGLPNSPWSPGASDPSSPSDPGTSAPGGGSTSPGTSSPGGGSSQPDGSTPGGGSSEPGTSTPGGGTTGPGTSQPGGSTPVGSGGGSTTGPEDGVPGATPGGGDSAEPTDPGDGSGEQPSEDPTQPAEEPTQPAEEPTQPAEEPTQPSEEPTQPAEEPTQPAEEPTQPSEEPTDPPVAPAPAEIANVSTQTKLLSVTYTITVTGQPGKDVQVYVDDRAVAAPVVLGTSATAVVTVTQGDLVGLLGILTGILGANHFTAGYTG